MGLNASTADDPSGTAVTQAGDIRIQEPNVTADRYLRQADAVFPFTPDIFLDELVQLFAMDQSGQPLSISQFRSKAAEVKNRVVAAFLGYYANSEAAPPRAPGESDVAYLLHAWRDHVWHIDDKTSAGAALPVRDPLAALAPGDALDFRPPEREPAVRDTEQQTHHGEPEPGPVGRRGSGTILAVAAMVLALASIAVSLLSAFNQNRMIQAMTLDARQRQDRLLAETHKNTEAIQALTRAIRLDAASASTQPAAQPPQSQATQAVSPPVAPPVAAARPRSVPLSPSDPLMRLQPGQPFDLQNNQTPGAR